MIYLVTLLLVFKYIYPTITLNCNCDYSTCDPLYTTTLARTSSCLCIGCTYTHSYPPGYNYVSVDYNYSKHYISQDFYQNHTLVGTCPEGLYCSQQIKLNPSYRLYMNWTLHSVPIDVNGLINTNFPITHKLNFYNKEDGTTTLSTTETTTLSTTETTTLSTTGTSTYINECDCPPELNVNESEQDGVINSLCAYIYEQTFGKKVLIDMLFDNPINVKISSNDTNKILFNQTSDVIFTELNTWFENIIIELSTIVDNVKVFKFNVSSVDYE